LWIDIAAAAARQALHRNPTGGMDRSSSDDDWQRTRETILPPHLNLSSTVDLDCWARNMAVVGPHAGRFEIAMEPMGRGFETDCQAGWLLDYATRRHPEQINERAEPS